MELDEIREIDREAAMRALARNWPTLDCADPKYNQLIHALAEFHRLFGTARFELRYNLRPPSNRTEEWQQQFIHGQISEEKLRSLLKADAERPIDIEMLTTFCEAYQDKLAHYSRVLQKAVPVPFRASSSERDSDEKEIADHITALLGKLPLWRENLLTVFEFLDERRILSGAGLVQLGEFGATSAHWLAELLFTRMTQGWQSCVEVSRRSHTDPRYLYSATAIDLFHQSWLKSFPSPQKLSERLREEFLLARAALKNSAQLSLEFRNDELERSTNSPGEEWSIDNESRELVLIGEVFSIVGQAGHIFRPTPNADWGIDGEIEFKDSQGRPSGQRVYLQLKSGDSYLKQRANGGEWVFTVKNVRHLDYWSQQAYPVMLVIRQSYGLIRWMDVSAYLRSNGHSNRQLIFRGEQMTAVAVRDLATQTLKIPQLHKKN